MTDKAALSPDDVRQRATREARGRHWIGRTDTLDATAGAIEWRKRVEETYGNVVTTKGVFEIVLDGHYAAYLAVEPEHEPDPRVIEIRDGGVLIIADTQKPERIGSVLLR